MTKTKKHYVSMTDKFMSGWGMAEGKINILVLKCDTKEEATVVKTNAQDRPEMKKIKIHASKPTYNNDRYLVSCGNKTTCPTWFRKDRPFKRV